MLIEGLFKLLSYGQTVFSDSRDFNIILIRKTTSFILHIQEITCVLFDSRQYIRSHTYFCRNLQI